MTAAEQYDARVRAFLEQRTRLWGEATIAARWDEVAEGYRADPRRPLDANLARIAGLVQPGDIVVDVGGGAGRIGLPLAFRCRELVNVEPSREMGRLFEELARESAVQNARLAAGTLADHPELRGDVVLSVDVIYFVSTIRDFVRSLGARANRLAAIWTWHVPPPSLNAELFALIYGEEQALPPDYRDLLPVFWELDLLPEVQLLPEPFDWPVPGGEIRTREAAVDHALEEVEAAGRSGAREIVEAHLDDLYRVQDGAWLPRWRPRSTGMLITWTPQ